MLLSTVAVFVSGFLLGYYYHQLPQNARTIYESSTPWIKVNTQGISILNYQIVTRYHNKIRIYNALELEDASSTTIAILFLSLVLLYIF